MLCSSSSSSSSSNSISSSNSSSSSSNSSSSSSSNSSRSSNNSSSSSNSSNSTNSSISSSNSSSSSSSSSISLLSIRNICVFAAFPSESVARQPLNLTQRFAAFSCCLQNRPFPGLLRSSSPSGPLRIPVQCLFFHGLIPLPQRVTDRSQFSRSNF